jgi:hypothetical protein
MYTRTICYIYAIKTLRSNIYAGQWIFVLYDQTININNTNKRIKTKQNDILVIIVYHFA